jgi:plastocyanin
VAKDLAFQPTSLTIKADTATDIVLDNQEAVPHNIAIKDAAGTAVFKGEIVTSTKVTNAVPALAAGPYTFWCEVHPNMTGTLTAE